MVGLGGVGDVADILVDVFDNAVIAGVHEPYPGLAYLVVEGLVLADRGNPGVAEQVAVVEEVVGVAVEAVAEVPERGEVPFLAFAAVAEEVGRAVVGLGVRHYFLHQVVAGRVVEVHVFPEFV